ncbi:MAG: hypothetical protein E6Q24_17140 [Chitinophagaceae bacterium]|jgi:hypothetical protein|nr:hypothetical protein [Sphingobacteriales bacterium]OJW03800.1 MAG: hypothetical protein BGO52_16680 [Sphingobacteriales bacterium 44-61]TXJ23672.1 MAG: hypothetical protein E6Q24_17140 [Chitinophagaceae bacterium]
MKKLSETWFAEGFIDFELKKYTLLAYLQEVNKYFDQNKLYPQLADVVFHYNNLVAFRENKRYLQEYFPKKLTGIQLEKLQLLYEEMIEDSELMQELEEIIQYAADNLRSTLQTGADIYEFVEEKINIMPVGLIPLDTQEGYFFLSTNDTKSTLVYQYRLSIFEKHDEKFRSIKTSFIDERQRGIAFTYEHIKAELIRHRRELPNPAVYCIESGLSFPIDETLLPIAKRSLVKFITTQAAA